MISYYLFVTSLFFLSVTWIFYPLFLYTLDKIITIVNFKIDSKLDNPDFTPSVTIIIAAHNEANNLRGRCENIFSQDYVGPIEVIIASDGSTDHSNQVVGQLKENYAVTLIDIQPQNGRSNAHNLAILHANHDILVFTDAETVFDVACLKHLMKPFSTPEVGFASGTLKYFNQDINVVSQSVGLYWHFEMFLRTVQTKLGLYATGTGACCAVRNELYQEIPATGDVDFITPLDVVLQGKKCVHSSGAIAWDELPDNPRKEFNARVRMTSKNFKGTLARWGLLAYFRKPVYSLSILLHKVGRWLTPFFMLSLLIGTLFSLDKSVFFVVFLGLQLFFYLLGLLGSMGFNFMFSSQIYSFLLANAGFFLGVIKALFGLTPKHYKPVGQQ